MDYKIIISLISVALVFVGYGPYIRDIFRRKTTPHTFTFLVWGIASSITWALQVHGGAGVGAWITFAVSAVCIFIFFLCLKYGEKSITISDVVFLILALFSLFLWLVVKQPVLSVILVVLTDILGFGPTVRKSWNKPHSETLFTWWVAAFRHTLGIIALEKFNLFTLLYPVAWSAANVIFCLILIVRRRQVKQDF
ncbi:hypothetical protein A3D42_00570 [Candidatus Nomurabacteria bacterium RIFCSPHIGHO2_02_FULL_41_18]|uniref:Uncharacterized protein n=1 Tax=Candidatus Nomurabacteria bacterium RIFCSPHIGHO2_02_FULL_41_18 TaxID=1801754 RepID=A0A1F6W7P4_9BACT|nr:MAG: hypothetical protein A2737_02525 [Candidatus Nomurabacteria bacterium RIFCSPHIGHO2_01_FULL_41_71]OGI77913.1 MAG: hypothetical protein A3D42_00570 [Candidatus Nomurabacteria bacterium RIFCSPHIGHO2_02_FULL_41_18]OGI90087.1 MAG: hypothetical protein A3B01_00990 [Candidatus Nomurabacteria bacterium RIFCSPLOWO2_01_FULL_41_52b]OGJ00255.1 MAG: hypothetical protein A3I90_01775 [Candidatus Nomurabacteria bacterium RIFCSPLOWO2_02_FULL_41_9]